MKKIIALVLALAMLLMVGAVFAEDNSNLGAPFDGDTHSDTTFTGVADGSVALGGLDNGDVVKFYQVLKFDQNAKREDLGTKQAAAGWAVTEKFLEAVSAAELEAILTTGITSELAGQIGKKATGNTPYSATAVGTEAGKAIATTAVDPGLYVAIVIPANAGWMFNPVFVASDYYKTGDASNSSSWTVAEKLSYSNEAMAKKAPIEVTKEAEEVGNASNEEGTAKAVGVGDTIKYTITTTIPEFAENYTKPVFIISDKLSAGLTFGGNSTITVTPTLAEGDSLGADDYDITNPDGLAFKITFKPASLLKLSAATKVVVTYTATVTEKAITNVNEEDNTVTVEYSHEPSVDDEGEGKKVGDKTHHYTFTIDGNIWGNTGYETSEIVKVGLDKNGNEITTTRPLDNGNEVGALAGAQFKLYTSSTISEANEYNKGDHLKETFVSDEDGHIQINGLDAGDYWLVETQAPAGYIRQQSPIHIKISADFYDQPVTWTENGIEITSDDILKSYKVEIDEVKTAEYVLSYTMNSENTLPVNDVTTDGLNGFMATEKGDIVVGNEGPIKVEDPVEGADYGKVKNTQGTELPSTGGIGTTIFYILGGLLVVGAVVILVARRKAQD